MNEILNQIKKIKGVKTIKSAGDDMAVISFEGGKKEKPIAINCQTQDQYDFVLIKNGIKKDEELKINFIGESGIYVIPSKKEVTNICFHNEFKLIPFDEYIDLNDLNDKWPDYLNNKIQERPIAVKCTNKEQWDFLRIEHTIISKYRGGGYVLTSFNACSDLCWRDYSQFSFDNYLNKYNFKQKFMSYLEDKANKRYKKGDKLISLNNDGFTFNGHIFVSNNFKVICININDDKDRYKNLIYKNGIWAQKVPGFLKEDLKEGGVYMFKFDKFYPC